GASDASTLRTGSIEYLGSALPLGRPRCEHAVTFAPRSVSHSIVGKVARMRKSSTTSPSRTGTLKSARRSTRRPLTSPRSSRVGTFKGLLVRCADDLHEV